MSEQRPYLQVIPGGLAETTEPGRRHFSEAWATSSRLMGVVVSCIRWSRKEDDTSDAVSEPEDLWQYFYYDFEGDGLTRCEQYEGEDGEERRDLELSFIGGLGSRKVPISQKQAVYLLQRFVWYNRNNGLELPDNPSSYLFLMDMDGSLTAEEARQLMLHCSETITTRNMLANYFVMRLTGRDYEGASLLLSEEYAYDYPSAMAQMDILPDLPAGTLYRNRVRLQGTSGLCSCEAVIDADGYYIIVLELTFDGLSVQSWNLVSRLALTYVEAHMNLSRPEYVAQYVFSGEPEDFQRSALPVLRRAMVTEEHDGRTFVIYNKDNSHVDSSLYLLHGDVFCVIHIGDSGEMLAASLPIGEGTVDGGDGSRQVGLLLGSITHDHHLLQRLVVFAQEDVTFHLRGL